MTANNLALLQPFFRDRAKNAQRLHALARVEDVVNDAFEVVRVVGVGHHLGGVGGRQLERVDELLLIVAVAQHLQQALSVPNILQVRMVCWHSAILDELDNTGLWQGLKLCPKFSIICLSCSISIMLWISLTSQNSGSQWMRAEQTRIGWATSL